MTIKLTNSTIVLIFLLWRDRIMNFKELLNRYKAGERDFSELNR